MARAEPFFDALLTRDGAGGSWLGPLLRAAPHGRERLGELVDAPGWLEATVAVHTASGRRGSFEYAASPTRRLLAWLIDHPDELVRPADDDSTVETAVLRRALIDDEPPGARARAQDRAHHLLRRGIPLGGAWWRFEDAGTLDCVLITDRLVVTVQGRRDEAAAPATPWLPRRSRLVRDLEAAQRLADSAKPWATLLLSDAPVPDGGDAAVAAAIEAGAPHLEVDERRELGAAYLGNLSWAQAGAAVGLDLESLPGR